MNVNLYECTTDHDYEEWRQVRLAVEPDERCDTVAELRSQDSPNRLMLLAEVDGTVVGSGVAKRSSSTSKGFVAPRVRHEHRRRGIGSVLIAHLAAHCDQLDLPAVQASVGDEGSLRFAKRFGFTEVDRQIEQVRVIDNRATTPPPPAGVDVVTDDERPDLWAASFDTFGAQVLADFSVYTPLEVTAEEWNTEWRGDPMFLAVNDGEVIGCAGLIRDAERLDHAEHALTAVRRGWRGRGIAAHLKRRTTEWAAANGIRELSTWTQAGNQPMLTLNDHLGYTRRRVSVTVSGDLPLPI